MTCAQVLFIDEKNERCHAKVANAFRAGSHRGREEDCRGRRFQRTNAATGNVLERAGAGAEPTSRKDG